MVRFLYQNSVGLSGMATRQETKRQWISGLAIVLTALVCLFGFARISPGLTFLIAAIAFVALVIFFWLAGRQAEGN